MNEDLHKAFSGAYTMLNEEQKKVVDTLQGPVIINAGPGSGKTQVLSLRIANILKELDVSPGNIVCLTYTEAAAVNMKQRLARFIGPDSYKVSIHTFHAFAAEIINQFPDKFFGGAKFSPIDSVTQFEVLDTIFSSLPLTYKSSSYHPTKGYVYLESIRSVIANLKKEGFNAQEFHSLLTINNTFFSSIKPELHTIIKEFGSFSSRNKDRIQKLQDISTQITEVFSKNAIELNEYRNYFSDHKAHYIFQHHNIAQTYHIMLEQAVKECIESNKTTPFSAFKKKLYTKKGDSYVIDEQEKCGILFETAEIYTLYEKAMYTQGYYDFSDMILEVLRRFDTDTDLQSELQERFQYILVDEFQDTNGSQLQLVEYLLSNEIGEPNILVVGDSDQTIYKFQGAAIGNFEAFLTQYPTATAIDLYKNYRSNQKILDFAQHVIGQAEVRDQKPHLQSMRKMN